MFLLVFLSFLNFPITKAAENFPIFLRENCTSTERFTQNSAFQTNLGILLFTLSSNANGKTQYYNTTIAFAADGSQSDAVYGHFMCRGDIPQDLCKECVYNATRRLTGSLNTCPFSKGAILWYEECMFRYSDQNFFSRMETRPRMRLRNTANVTDGIKQTFMRLLYTTLNETADEAAKTPIGVKKYATRQVNFSAFQTLSVVIQCTPDLSTEDCRRCLSLAIEDVAWCCTYRIGGRVLYPSCNFRYEFYPFSLEASLAPNPTPSTLENPTRSAEQNVGDEGSSLESLQFTLAAIEAATNNFSHENKIGKGGFGEVYKGILVDGRTVAIKRLSKCSGQGA